MNDAESNLKMIFVKVFALEKVPANFLSLQLGDLVEWDSMGNFNLLLAVEEEYGIRFSIEQIGEIRSIQEILENLHD
jgi:acyl carrier protein